MQRFIFKLLLALSLSFLMIPSKVLTEETRESVNVSASEGAMQNFSSVNQVRKNSKKPFTLSDRGNVLYFYAILLVGLIQLISFLPDPSKKAKIFLSLFCFSFSIKFMPSIDYADLSLESPLSSNLSHKIELFGISLSLLFGFLYLNELSAKGLLRNFLLKSFLLSFISILFLSAAAPESILLFFIYPLVLIFLGFWTILFVFQSLKIIDKISSFNLKIIYSFLFITFIAISIETLIFSSFLDSRLRFNDLIFGLVLFLSILSIYKQSYENRKATEKNTELKSELKEQNREIILKNNQIKNQLDEIQRDMKVAGDVMRVMLPKNYYSDKRVSIKTLFVPAENLAGDLYGLDARNGRVFFWLCDVTGHGLAASLVAGVIRESITLMKDKVIFGEKADPAKLLFRLSKKVREAIQERFFATMTIGVVDYKLNQLIISNAAHLAPFFMKSDSIKCKPKKVSNGPLIGFSSDSSAHQKNPYKNTFFDFESGDLYLFYTDGLNEAENPKGRQFGKPAIAKFIEKYSEDEDLIFHLFDKVSDFQKKDFFSDDISMTMLRFL